MINQNALEKENVAKRIAGEIVLSNDAGKTIQKWRNIFKIPQRTLADHIGIMPSVISDYENSRRKSPGIRVIRKIVDAMIELDEKTGSNLIREFSNLPTKNILSEAVLDIKEFSGPVLVKDFCKKIGVELVARNDLENSKIYGYTVVDSLKAIIDLPPLDLVKLYGLTSERALIFTGAHQGKSSMVALKVTNLRPGLVVLHGISEKVDDLAKRIAEIENIPLAISESKNVNNLIENLRKHFGRK